MLARLRKAGGVIGAVVAVLAPAACSGGHGPSSAHPAPPPLTVAAPGHATAWGSVLAQIQPDGSFPTSAALEAFDLTVAAVPGSRVPSGPPGLITDGSIGLLWTVGRWSRLSKVQQVAVTSLLVPSGRAPQTTNPQVRPYLAAVERAENQIASAMGRTTTQDVRVVLNQTSRGRASALAYTMSFDQHWGFTGAAAHCVIYVNPVLYRYASAALIELVMDHEVFHCFQADDFPSVGQYAASPTWLSAGSAEWVGDSLDPVTDSWWIPYLTDTATPLFARTFDAVGFFAHMAETGSDPWKYLDTMMGADNSAAAFAYGVDDEFRATWASSLAGQPFGTGWQTTGPGIVPTTYRPPIVVVGNGSTLTRSVAPYANVVVPIDVVADVIDITVSNSLARLHGADGSEHDGSALANEQFCVTSNCSACPDLAPLSRLPSGPAWLAVTGDVAGATYSVSGVKAICGACPVGTWISTAYNSTGPAAETISGGSGIGLTISTSGRMAISYSEMDPLVISDPGQSGPAASLSAIFAGHQTGFMPISGLTERSGTFVSPSGRVALEYGYAVNLGGASSPEIENPFGTSGSVGWSCSGLTMTFQAAGDPGSRWTLARQP